jgi:hypothetical protein
VASRGIDLLLVRVFDSSLLVVVLVRGRTGSISESPSQSEIVFSLRVVV